MNQNVFTGPIKKTSEAFAEISNSMKLYESGELSYPDLSKHLLVILGDITSNHDDLGFRHTHVLQMIRMLPSRDSDEVYRIAIGDHIRTDGNRGKIPLIKLIQAEFGMGLKEAKELVEDLCEFDSSIQFVNFKED